jgi:hypothetical protein
MIEWRLSRYVRGGSRFTFSFTTWGERLGRRLNPGAAETASADVP